MGKLFTITLITLLLVTLIPLTEACHNTWPDDWNEPLLLESRSDKTDDSVDIREVYAVTERVGRRNYHFFRIVFIGEGFDLEEDSIGILIDRDKDDNYADDGLVFSNSGDESKITKHSWRRGEWRTRHSFNGLRTGTLENGRGFVDFRISTWSIFDRDFEFFVVASTRSPDAWNSDFSEFINFNDYTDSGPNDDRTSDSRVKVQ